MTHIENQDKETSWTDLNPPTRPSSSYNLERHENRVKITLEL